MLAPADRLAPWEDLAAMSLAPLLPIAGAALGSLAAQTTRPLSPGASFLDVLRGAIGGAASSSGSSIGGPLPGERVELENLRRDTQAALNSFVDTLRERLSAAGIDCDEPIELRPDGSGRILVGGAHPQRGEIEQALADDPALAAAFNLLAANFALLRAADERLATGQGIASEAKDFRLVLGDEAEVLFD